MSTNCAFAQIIPDGTLPNNSSVKLEGNNSIIEGGTQAGGNLFHSFREFSVPTNGAALFNNKVDIQNIISRVTGGSVSNIDGIIGTKGTANLFLINPNGIVFGQNAQLNVGGSFVATSANALQFGNIGFFSATAKNIPSPLLTINPSALLFNQINQNAVIQNNSVAFAGQDPAGIDAFGLRVPDGRSLLLVGGNVSMDGGKLNAYGGRVELGGLGEPGTVALGVDGDNLSLRFPSNVARTDISLTNSSGVFVTGAGGGNIAVNAKNLEILGGSILSGGIGPGLGTPETVAGDITLNATGSIKVAGTGSIVRNLVCLGSQGNGGNIIIDSVTQVTISGSSSNINSGLFVNSQSTTGTAGDIIVTSPRVTLDNSGVLSAQSASGNGGNINLQTDLLLLRRGASISTSAGTAEAGGNGGNITINAPSGFIVAVPNENSDITADAFRGNGGRVDIQAFGIYGIQPRSNPTSLSDITASSEFGVTPDVDPNIGLVNLPTLAAETEVAQTCQAGGTLAKSSFTITGRGGLPPNPGDALNTDAVQVDLVTLNPNGNRPNRSFVPSKITTPAPEPIIEATGLALNEKGEVVLTANLPTTTPHSPWLKPASCRAIRNS
ncbi:filamentous hemagglutinin N-terminal domain-containing protein [Nostoc sp. LPT]|uniref:two-partner secretion domain-containing protein n=1 Tax=Nostoc sp. LPT TaxID=2815387 RepID=UPI00260118FF|nr:filamentous hemagglutinin N-terminal domain-containing protein [Nostoc sp. LPT]